MKPSKLESTPILSIKHYPYLHIAYIILFNKEQNQGKVTIIRHLTDQAAVTIKQLQGNYSQQNNCKQTNGLWPQAQKTQSPTKTITFLSSSHNNQNSYKFHRKTKSWQKHNNQNSTNSTKSPFVPTKAYAS